MLQMPITWDGFWKEFKTSQLVVAFRQASISFSSPLPWDNLKSRVCKDFTKGYFWDRTHAFKMLCSWKESFSFPEQRIFYFLHNCAISHPNSLKIWAHNYDPVGNKDSATIIAPNEPKVLNFYFQVWLSSLPPLMWYIW